MFQPGDLVRLTEKMPDGTNNIRYPGCKDCVFKFVRLLDNLENPTGRLELVGVPEGWTGNKIGWTVSWYTDRFELVKQDITPGCLVRYKGKDGAIIRNSNTYACQALKDGKIKLVGVRNWMNVSQFEWAGKAAPIPEPVVKDQGEDLLEELQKKAANGVGTCSYAIQWKNGKRTFHVRDVCHARINRQWRGDENKDTEITHLALNLSEHYKECPDGEKEAYKTYIDWLVNRSFVKSAFIPRKIDDILKNGVLMNVEHNINVLATAAILTRHVSEFPSKRKLFGEVVDLGFSEEIGLFVSTFFDHKDKIVHINRWGGGHHALSNDMDTEELRNTFAKGFPEKDEARPYSKFHMENYAVFKTISPSYSKPHAVEISTFCEKNMKGLTTVEGEWGSKCRGYKGDNALVKVCASLAKYF